MIRFLVNPAAGRGKAKGAVAALRRLAKSAGADLVLSLDAADLADRAREAVLDGVGRLVVAGGDGTFHHVAGGLVGSECALGLVPLGRGNDLAAELGVPRDLTAAVECALYGELRQIDIGRVDGHHFTGYCGVGFDSEAARVAQNAGTMFRGPLVYVYSFVRTMFSYKAPVMRIAFDGGEFEGRAMFAVLCNISRFGGGMRIAPEAVVDDGKIELVIAQELTRLELLRVFPKVYRGDHVTHPAIRVIPTRSARVTVDRPMTVACDGELLFETKDEPVEVSLEPFALWVVTPSKMGNL